MKIKKRLHLWQGQMEVFQVELGCLLRSLQSHAWGLKERPPECEWGDVKPGIFQFSTEEPTEARLSL